MPRRPAGLAAGVVLLLALSVWPSPATPHPTVLQASAAARGADLFPQVLFRRHLTLVADTTTEVRRGPPASRPVPAPALAKARVQTAGHVGSTYRRTISSAPPPVAVGGAAWCKKSPLLTAAVVRWGPLLAADGRRWPVATMELIMCGESGGNPTLYNTAGSGACGLLQLLPCPSGGLDPATNIADAYAKYVSACAQPAWRYDCLHPWGR